MNYELIDNICQVIVLVCSAFIALIEFIRYKNYEFLILTFAYTCFAMGTLFFVLHIIITGVIPQVFYVSEISWIAAYFFFLAIQIVRTDNLKLHLSLVPLLAAIWVGGTTIAIRVMGPSFLVSGLFAVVISIVMYISVFRLQKCTANRKTDCFFIACIVLQIGLYFTSGFISDYTRFNIYFGLDSALTISAISILPLIHREVVNK